MCCPFLDVLPNPQCIVFNTTEKLDVQHMRRLLMGITTAGAWACFDEFNRMDMEVLSVVAKQIMTIQAALAAGERFFMFDGRNIAVHKVCHVSLGTGCHPPQRSYSQFWPYDRLSMLP